MYKQLYLLNFRPIDLKLKRNTDITSSGFKTYVYDDDGINILDAPPQDCHYLHEDDGVVASISICTPKNVVRKEIKF